MASNHFFLPRLTDQYVIRPYTEDTYAKEWTNLKYMLQVFNINIQVLLSATTYEYILVNQSKEHNHKSHLANGAELLLLCSQSVST